MGPVVQSVDGTLHAQGVVHGGQNGVKGANIYLYTVGTGGLGSLATNKLMTPVTTDQFGFFGLTNDYHCANSTDQMYLAAVGGDPGVGQNNPALVLLVALGDCGNLNANTFISVNEVTTAAAAWAIGQFAAGYDHIGATSTNATGIRNAFLDAQLIADSGLGVAATIPSNLTVESQKLYALADALAPCVNSLGTAGSPCDQLFAAANGGSTPSDTFMAAVSIVEHPKNNVGAVWGLINADAPFPTTLTAAPHDWSMSMTVTGGGLTLPTTLGLDKQGNVWVADYNGALSAFGPQGAAMSSTGFGVGQTSEVYGLAVDPNGDIWVTNEQAPAHSPTQGSVSKFQGVGGTPGTLVGTYYDSSIDFPESIAVDSNGYIDIANYANGTATIYNETGGLVLGGIGSGSASFPVSIIADATHGVWLANSGNQTVTHIAFADPTNIATSAQTVTVVAGCCSAANALASDQAGNIWVANFSGSTVSEISASNNILISKEPTGGSPAGMAVDGAQNVWVLNYRSNSITELAGSFSTSTAGTILSNSIGGDASLSEPFSLQADASGNVWVANYANNDVVMFFGLAAPTITPLQPFAAAP